jgi:hypothetical protein
MTVTQKALTKTEVLAQALRCAIERPMEEVISDLNFGRYAAEDNGWYWEIKFTRTFGMTSQAKSDGDTMDRRLHLIVERWASDCARYESPVAVAS